MPDRTLFQVVAEDDRGSATVETMSQTPTAALTKRMPGTAIATTAATTASTPISHVFAN